MKRILFGGILIAFFVLLQPTSAPLADEKVPTPWETEGDFKVLRVWKTPGLQLRWPEIAILQLTDKSRSELQCEPLKFLQDHKIFANTEEVRGQFVVRLMKSDSASKDAAIAVVAHDLGTYSGVSIFEVSDIKTH